MCKNRAYKTCSAGDCTQMTVSKTRLCYGLVVACRATGSGNGKKEVKNMRHLPRAQQLMDETSTNKEYKVFSDRNSSMLFEVINKLVLSLENESNSLTGSFLDFPCGVWRFSGTFLLIQGKS